MNKFENYLDHSNLKNALQLMVGGADNCEERSVVINTYSEWKELITDQLKEKNDLIDYKKYIEYKWHCAQTRNNYLLPLFSFIYPILFAIIVEYPDSEVIKGIFLAGLLIIACILFIIILSKTKKNIDDTYFYAELLKVIEEIINNNEKNDVL